MAKVEVRWRPSGGRGEYEHVPNDVLMGRIVYVSSIAVPGAVFRTDVVGAMRDGKPRLRRNDPNDRSSLNIHALIASMSLLPNPIREDRGRVLLPLRDKQYVISRIEFEADTSQPGVAICTPLKLRVLHDDSDIDLTARLLRVGKVLERGDLPASIAAAAERYVSLARAANPSAQLREAADELLRWLDANPVEAAVVDLPPEELQIEDDTTDSKKIELAELSADETRRRLVAHYQIDRSRKLRRAKVDYELERNGSVACENCTFDFEKHYGERGRGFIEVHHRQPLAALLPNTMTKASDLALLCANCHRIVHRRPPLLTLEELANISSF